MKRRLRRGATMLEAAVASGVTVIVLVGAFSTFLMGTSSWIDGSTKIDTDTTATRAVRKITSELREAWWVKVDASGKRVDYKLPKKNADGTYMMPVQDDGIARRIEQHSHTIRLVADGMPTQILASDVINTDPLRVSPPTSYDIFTPGSGGITRSLTVMVVSRKKGHRGNKELTSRARETIYLRNIPELVR